MPEGRPDIPMQMERDVKKEAGYRCAIPTCRSDTVVIHHIVEYAQVKAHTFDNLIALCPNCHAKVHAGVIDRKAVIQVKGSLSVLNARYGDVERKTLRWFADNPEMVGIDLPGGLQIFLYDLLNDGMLVDAGMAPWATQIQGANTHDRYLITDRGREFISRWLPRDLQP